MPILRSITQIPTPPHIGEVIYAQHLKMEPSSETLIVLCSLLHINWFSQIGFETRGGRSSSSPRTCFFESLLLTPYFLSGYRPNCCLICSLLGHSLLMDLVIPCILASTQTFSRSIWCKIVEIVDCQTGLGFKMALASRTTESPKGVW